MKITEDKYNGASTLLNRRIVLASGSPRRLSLLKQIGIYPEVIKSKKPEVITSSDPIKVVQELSLQKAEDVAEMLSHETDSHKEGYKSPVIIGADTVVAADGRILGKPKDHDEAYQMIKELAGKTHQVYTGVTLIDTKKEASSTFAVKTDVSVYPMTEEEIRGYADSDEPMDKAGAYGIQGNFAKFIKGINGDYNNVVGLPLSALYRKLRDL